MALFEIHQGFKGHFLNELRVSFNYVKLTTPFINTIFKVFRIFEEIASYAQ